MDWRDFNNKAALYLESTVPEDRNISNDQVEELTRSFSKDINRAMESLLLKGMVGRGKPLKLDGRVDHFFKERRRLKRALRRMNKWWNHDPDRIEIEEKY